MWALGTPMRKCVARSHAQAAAQPSQVRTRAMSTASHASHEPSSLLGGLAAGCHPSHVGNGSHVTPVPFRGTIFPLQLGIHLES